MSIIETLLQNRRAGEAGLVVATLVSCGGALVAAVVARLLLPRRDVLLAGVDSHMTAE